MNSVVLFKNGIMTDFDYLKVGDAYRGGKDKKIRIFVSGNILSSVFVEKFNCYRINFCVLYYDVKRNVFAEQRLIYYSKNNKIKFNVVGVYRKIV